MNANHPRRTLLLAAILLALGPCVAQAQTPAAGPQRTYTPGPFDELEIMGSAQVRFTQGGTDQVVVEGDDELQREVRLDLSNGRLQVRQAGTWRFWNNRRLQLNVTARELKHLSVSGAADFVAAQPVKAARLVVDISGAGLARFDRLQADELRFTVSGAGDGQFAGGVEQLAVSISGKSNFRGEQLQAQRARVAVSGLGEVQLWAEKELAIAISGIGTVDYWGSPTVKRSTSGLATVNARGAKPAQQ